MTQALDRTEDPRAERSRAALIATIGRLGEASDATPNVSTVTRAANVHRATFYNHFESVEQLAVDAIDEQLERLREVDYRGRHEGLRPEVVGARTLDNILQFFDAHPGLYRIASAWVASSGLSGVGEVIRRQVHSFRVEFDDSAAAEGAEAAAEETYIAGGMTAVFAAVLSGDLPRDHASIRLLELLPEWMQHPLRA
ncbi:MAG TPA: TetR/AcrR family transcriptional regulator [Sporichthyaceae bacterium]|jgi:AcrR family transcriptional regulator|nr:TetR/AcrR family transcriptional regulator [Sporichthyaceae bacterium]